MNTPSPADRVESALTPPWGPRLDHFLAARDEMKRPAPAQAPDTFRQEYVFQGDWHPDSEGFLAPDPNGPRPEDPVGMCTCSDLPAVMEAEVLPPAEADSAGATPAAALVPEVLPIRRIHLGGGFTVDAWDPKHVAAVKAGPLTAEEQVQAEARLHREGQTSPHFFPGSLKEAAAVLGGPSEVAEYIRVAREEVIPLVTSPEGAALAEALRGTSGAFARLEVLLGALGKSAGRCIDDFLLFRDEFPWDPKLCASPEYPDLPQKGRSPKAYHHQFQPGEGRRETAPSRTTRDAARAARKAKKKGRR